MDALHGYLCLDFETTSAVTPMSHGAWAYSQHESTRVYCAVFAYATSANAKRGDYKYHTWRPGEVLPRQIVEFIKAGGRLLAFNAGFERAVIANICTRLHDWPEVALDQWVDVQTLGLAVNLPKSLEGLAKSLGCPIQKDLEGGKLMKAMAKAEFDYDLGRWIYPMDTPANRARLEVYCALDVGATLDSFFRLPPLSVLESLVERVDAKVNARGVYLDLEFAQRMLKMTEQRKKQLALNAFGATYAELENATATPALKTWLIANGVKLPKVSRKKADGTFHKTESCDRASVATILKDPDTPEHVRDVLSNRIEANKTTSLAKLSRVDKMIGSDGRLRNALQYCGAHTGRWTSYGLQIHNLPKDKLGAGQSALARTLIDHDALDLLTFFEERPLAVMSQQLRSVIAAAPGHEIIGADFSAIEARVLAWLADDEDLLHQFREGNDIYVYTAESIDAWECAHSFTKGCPVCDQVRQLGKVCQLALGYGMGKLKLADTGGGWGVALPLKQWGEVHTAWRQANPCIVSFWRELEDAVRTCIEEGKPSTVGKIGVSKNDHCMFLTLPSGRRLSYWRPRIRTVRKESKTLDEHGAIITRSWEVEAIQFFTPKSGRLMVEETYGGKLVENVTQAIARDLLAEALIRIDRVDPYQIVMHVHDSIAAEVPAGEGSVHEFEYLMAEPTSWSEGLPLDAEGYRDVCFKG